MLIGAKLGMDVRIAAPRSLWPSEAQIAACQKFAKESGDAHCAHHRSEEAVNMVDFMHTDVWVSMGEPAEASDERIKAFLPYQANLALIKGMGDPRTRFMHCRPAFHNCEIKVGRIVSATPGECRENGSPH